MRLSDIIKHIGRIFEKKRKNPIQLDNDSNLESNLKHLKVSDKSTPIQISEDTINVQGSLTVNGTSVSTEPDDDSAVITALNSATENELVTVGATTTELDAEANLTFDGDDLSLAATGKIYLDGGGDTYITENADDSLRIVVGDVVLLQLISPGGGSSDKVTIPPATGLYFDGGGDTYILESSSDNLRFVVGGVTMLDMSETANPSVNVNNSNITIDATKKLHFDGGIIGDTYIYESAADILDFYVGAKKMLALDEANGRITLATGKLVAAIANGTEYSATDSAYAGMILGYTCIGANVADDSYTLTTSFVPFTDSGGTAISVTFKTPPSEYVEIEVELYFSAGSGASDLELSLSDNVIYGGNSLVAPTQFEKSVREPARGHSGTVTQKWFLQADNLEAIGSTNRLFIAARCDSTSGTPIIRWGGDATGEYTNLVMKAVALPATIVEGS